jgi:hypothetical protein
MTENYNLKPEVVSHRTGVHKKALIVGKTGQEVEIHRKVGNN